MNSGLQILLPVLTVAGFGLAFGIILSYAAKRFAPEVNKMEEKVFSLLPAANCGACGYAGCQAFARELVKQGADVSRCPVMDKETQNEISRLLGVEAEEAKPKIAAVHCQGGTNCAFRAGYAGIKTCAGEYITAPGRCACDWGCLGYGDCVEACPFEAIFMGDEGYPVVIKEKCTGCGRCVEACPKDIITLIPSMQKVYLGCRNPNNGKTVKDICKKGCIGCRLCSLPKITPSGKVVMKGNLPDVPPDWEDFDMAVEKCPGKCFVLPDKQKAKLESRV
ncbi:MAG: RnfABCDGE type electron transport complex subunit B [Candidatus Aureabacteria bacterium]|nr:RnfABCDGE type electron transport complex subunit B [Candidatus Auribacterota bacterium]